MCSVTIAAVAADRARLALPREPLGLPHGEAGVPQQCWDPISIFSRVPRAGSRAASLARSLGSSTEQGGHETGRETMSRAVKGRPAAAERLQRYLQRLFWGIKNRSRQHTY